MKKINKTILLLLILIFVSLLSIFIIYYFTTDRKKSEYINVDLKDINISFLDMSEDLYTYDLNGYKTSIGVDLSEFNKDVNFEALKTYNIEYVFLRLGWRGYIDPSLHDDKLFEEYYQKAKEAGLDIGVYFFSQAIDTNEAIEEARYVINKLKDKEIDTYIAYDYETIEDKDARTNKLSRRIRTENAIAFLQEIENAGYNPILYTNYDWIKHHYTIDVLNKYPIWYAQYSKKPQYKGSHLYWQYATEIKLEGVSPSGIDLNLLIKKEEN